MKIYRKLSKGLAKEIFAGFPFRFRLPLETSLLGCSVILQ